MSLLMKCPFCGAIPDSPQREGGRDERDGYNFKMTIRCRCGATLSRSSSEDKQGWCNDTGQAEKAVVDAWNKRAKDGK